MQEKASDPFGYEIDDFHVHNIIRDRISLNNTLSNEIKAMILSGDFTPPKSREQSMLGKVTEVMQPPNEKPVLKIPEDGKSTKNLGMIYFSPQV